MTKIWGIVTKKDKRMVLVKSTPTLLCSDDIRSADLEQKSPDKHKICRLNSTNADMD